MQSLLFENPWPIVFVCGALAVVLWVVGNRQRRTRLTRAAIGAAVVGVVVYVAARVVTTDREVIAAQTEALVMATAPLDVARVESLLARGAYVSGPDGTPWIEYDRIRPQLERVTSQRNIANHTIRNLVVDVEPAGTRARSIIDLRTSVPDSGTGLPIQSVWELHWRKETADPEQSWRVAEIRWREFMQREPERSW